MKRQYILQRVAGPVEKHDSFFPKMNNLRSFNFSILINFLLAKVDVDRSVSRHWDLEWLWSKLWYVS